MTHPISNNVAAAIVVDGKLVAAAEEERFTRIKYSPSVVAANAIDYVMREAGIKPSDVDLIATTFRGPIGHRYLGERLLEAGRHALAAKVKGSSLREEFGFRFFSAQLELGLNQHVRKVFGEKPLLFIPHHVCHAASSYFCSGFKKSMVMTLDGRGESSSGLLGFYDSGDLEIVRELELKESLGHLYGEFTRLIGFRYHSEEGKTMGLAPYGRPIDSLESVLKVRGLRVDIDWNRLQGLEVPNWVSGTDPTRDSRKDLAASAQHILEGAAVGLVQGLRTQSDSRSICLAGGVALNIDMNYRILESGGASEIFVQPGAHDAGCAVGAAFFAYHEETGELPDYRMAHAYLGPSLSGGRVQETMERLGLESQTVTDDEIPHLVGEALSKGKTVAWMKGRLEFGPRALGARSLLASPLKREMWGKVNAVKGREWWRPLAPSIMEEETESYFNEQRNSPFMLLKFTAKDLARERMPAAIHVDGSTRPQTVSRAHSRVYWETIKEFQKLTGVPAVINTSLNLPGDPIACSEVDGLKTFFLSGIDYILIEDHLLKKPNQ